MEIDNISKKYDINKILLINLEKQYGGLENFKQKYIEAIINNKLDSLKISKKIEEKLITYFDLSSPTGIGKKDGYIKLLEDIFNKNIFFLTDKDIKNNINDIISELPYRKREVIQLYYGINEEKKGSKEICNKFNITRESVRNIKERAIIIIQKNHKFLRLKEKILKFENEKEQILKEYFKNNDIFYNPTSQENKAIELLKIGYEVKINNLEFFSYEECVMKIKELKQEINNLIISEDDKNYLIKILNDKKVLYESLNQRQIVFLYEHKIDKMQSNNKLKEVINKSITELNLPIRAYNCLISDNIFTIGDLLSLDEEELLKIQNIGKKIFNDVLNKLNEQGLSFITKEEKSIIENSVTIEELKQEILKLNISEQNKKHLICKLNKKKEKVKHNFQKDIVDKYLEKIENVPVFLENEDILDMNIKDLGLSTRTYNGFSRANITSVIELVNISEERIMNIRGIGTNSLKEIKDKLNSFGIRFLTAEEIKNGKYYINYKDLRNQIKNLDINDKEKQLLLLRLEKRVLQTQKRDVDSELKDAIEVLQEEYKQLAKLEQEKMKKMEENEVSK